MIKYFKNNINTIFRISFILKNHLRLLTNWLFAESNLIISIIAFVFILLNIGAIFNFLIQNNSSFLNIFFLNVLLVYLPTKMTKHYLKLTLPDENLLEFEFTLKDISKLRQFQSVINNTFFYAILLLLIYSFNLVTNILLLFFAIDFAIIMVISFFQPNFTRDKKTITIKRKTSEILWNYKISRIGLLPVRGIFIRTFLYYLRANKILIIKFLLSSIIINIISILFIVNNDKEEYIALVLFLQIFFLIFYLIDLPNENNIKLLKEEPSFAVSVLFGEYLFVALLFFIYTFLLILLYSLFFLAIPFFSISLLLIFTNILLFYVVLLRIAYLYEPLKRMLLFFISFILLPVPFIIFKCYRRIKCLSF